MAVSLCLAFACLGQAQAPTQQTTKQGDTLIGDSNGALVPSLPFACNVDGNTFLNIAACVSFLGSSPTTPAGGVITSDLPEDITSLPWDPAHFSGRLQLGKGLNSTSCTTGNVNCWVTEVPIIIGSGMSIIGSGKIGASGNFATGTAIVPGHELSHAARSAYRFF